MNTLAQTNPAPRLPRLTRTGGVVVTLAALLVLSILAAAGTGAVSLPPMHILAILAAQLGLDRGVPVGPGETALFLHLRLPRVVLAMVVGAGLAVCGAALQGLFRNPLADPGLVGVSGGAALGAGLVIVAGGLLAPLMFPAMRLWLLPIAAFGGGLAAALLVYRLGTRAGVSDITAMLLAGIAINAFAGAGLGAFSYFANDEQLRNLTFFTLGGLGAANWMVVAVSLAVVALVAAVFLRQARALNALLLGEAEATHLGVDVQATKRRIFLGVAAAVGVLVAFTGMIGFVGLVVPHLARMLLGPDHHRVLPVSMLLGALLVVLADLGARTLIVPAELPLGVLTAALGAPFFVWLLAKRGRE
ncbi:MAG: iron ABC transporter permease [Pseudomonadota bacterium]|jgi:iron complex transport system permease protein